MTPAQQLAASREAIARQLGHHRAGRARPADPDHPRAGDDPGVPSDHGGGWRLAQRALSAWWHHHPAYAATQVARPALDAYACEKPLQLVGVAAGLGAAAVLLRPWRLLSASAVAALVLKTSDLGGLLVSLLVPGQPSGAPEDPDAERAHGNA
ncbi:MAG: hypothetical protein KF740_02630 [Ramlibacter sp.]|nr:hypothetical protein [Ramlibacter sp.]